MSFDPDVMIDVLIDHQRTESSGCHCGRLQLGGSYAEHVVDEYEGRMIRREARATRS